MRLALEFLGYEISLRVGRPEHDIEDPDEGPPTHNDSPIQIFAFDDGRTGFLPVSDRFEQWDHKR
jgi:hypothetical protein